jgi:hypothetical protein
MIVHEYILKKLLVSCFLMLRSKSTSWFSKPPGLLDFTQKLDDVNTKIQALCLLNMEELQWRGDRKIEVEVGAIEIATATTLDALMYGQEKKYFTLSDNMHTTINSWDSNIKKHHKYLLDIWWALEKISLRILTTWKDEEDLLKKLERSLGLAQPQPGTPLAETENDAARADAPPPEISFTHTPNICEIKPIAFSVENPNKNFEMATNDYLDVVISPESNNYAVSTEKSYSIYQRPYTPIKTETLQDDETLLHVGIINAQSYFLFIVKDNTLERRTCNINGHVIKKCIFNLKGNALYRTSSCVTVLVIQESDIGIYVLKSNADKFSLIRIAMGDIIKVDVSNRALLILSQNGTEQRVNHIALHNILTEEFSSIPLLTTLLQNNLTDIVELKFCGDENFAILGKPNAKSVKGELKLYEIGKPMPVLVNSNTKANIDLIRCSKNEILMASEGSLFRYPTKPKANPIKVMNIAATYAISPDEEKIIGFDPKSGHISIIDTKNLTKMAGYIAPLKTSNHS